MANIKFNNTTKKKLETLYEELGYSIRYEKGNFNSGHCIVHERKLVVINRFFDTEGRARVLYDLLDSLTDIDTTSLSEESIKLMTMLRPVAL